MTGPPPPRPGALSDDRRRLLDRLLDREAHDAARISRASDDRTRAPLSAAQRRMWYFCQVAPGSPLYNITGVARLTGVLDREALRSGLDEVVRRHEILRTTYHDDDGEPWSRVEPAAPLAWRVHDLAELRPAEREATKARLIAEEGARPFDISHDRPLRAALLRIAPDEHLIQLTMQHIAADGWSLGILLGEVAALYAAFTAGRPSPLPELPVQYADFARWQNDRLETPEQRALLSEWTNALAHAAPLDLPTDRPRRTAIGFAGASVPFALPPHLVARIKRFADARGVTPYMVLVAAFGALLSRWCGGADDVVLGCAAAGRDRSETEPLIGFFVNTLALRLDFGGDPTMDAAVAAAATVCRDAYTWQSVPFERVIEELRPERTGDARVPLVRHMLVLHNDPPPRVRLPGLDVELLPTRTDTAKFELQIELTPASDGALRGWIEYSTDLFDEPTVRRFGDGLLALIDAALDRPGTPLTRLDLLTETDRRRVVERWSGATAPPLGDTPLHVLFEQAVDATPQAPAVVDAGEVVTYAALDRRANRLAHRIRALGVGRGDVVGVCLPRSATAIVAMLGALKAGAAYLPLDPAHPAARNARLAVDGSAALVVIGSRDVGAGLAAEIGDGRAGLLDIADEDVARSPGTRIDVAVRGDDNAYVIFTSGSTGAPKGAINGHAAVANRILWMQRTYDLGANEAVLHKTPLGFDVSVWEWLWPLTVGGRVVVVEPGGHRDPARIAEMITGHQITICHFVPSMLRAFIADPAAAACAGELRHLVCSGEELSPELVDRVHEKLPGVRLHNLYGPTEAAIDVTAWPVPERLTEADREHLPIGRPISGARMYVLDRTMSPAPPGVPGELYIGGAAIGHGYLGRPALTAERFVPDPFLPGRLYRTGDRARWRMDGALEFLGRLDDQVKIRGQRVEPGEAAAVLAAHPEVDHAVVIPFHDRDRAVQLAGYVTLRPHTGERPDADAGARIVDDWRAVVDERSDDSAPSPETVARIRGLTPSRMLDIGCGGALPALLAPGCARYHGIDISVAALDRARETIDGPTAESVTLERRAADELAGLVGEGFDTVVLNAVTQCFPSADYLIGVLKGALDLLPPGGRLFVGDVRDLALTDAMRCVELLDRLPGDTPVAGLVRAIAQEAERDESLSVHPALFQRIAAGCQVTTLARTEPPDCARYRYDVVIRVPAPDDDDSAADPSDMWTPWTGETAVPDGPPDRPLGWRGVPDARLVHELAAVRLCGADPATRPANVTRLRRRLAEIAAPPVDLAVLADLAARRGYTLLPHLGAEPGTLDIELRPPGGRGLPRTAPAYAATDALASDPIEARRLNDAIAGLRADARRRAPAHLIPASLTVLRAWPVGPNGKLDRASLPPPDGLRPVGTARYVPPRTPEEHTVAAAWREVLGLTRVGVHDDFFDIGGNSLLATRVVGRLRELAHRELPFAEMLRVPTVAALADLLGTAPVVELRDLAPIGRAERRRRTGTARTPRRDTGGGG